MVLKFLKEKLNRHDPRQDVIDSLYARIVTASRAPTLYASPGQPGAGIPDSTQGRLESLVVHVVLVLRRLRQLPEPAAEIAQDLVDTTFEQVEHALREIGIGDTTVPKRMKAIAKGFYGRAERYDEGLDAQGDELLALALGRNVLDEAVPAHWLAAYARAAESLLRDVPLHDMIDQRSSRALFPDPRNFKPCGDGSAQAAPATPPQHG